MRHDVLQIIAKTIYYIIIFVIYKYFGFDIAALYLLAAINTKLLGILYKDEDI